MNPIWIFAATFVGAVVITPLVRALAVRIGVVDVPKKGKLHASTVPLMGGVALFAAFLLFIPLTPQELPTVYPVLLAGFLVVALGLIDDVRQLRPLQKLLGQAAVAVALLVLMRDIRITGVVFVDFPLAFLWVVGLTNALNLMDNMDGLSAGVSALSALFLFVVGASSQDVVLMSLGLALAGACCGFLFYNAKPASIFMGDAGSMFLGLVLSYLGLRVVRSGGEGIGPLLAAPLLIGVPIFDTTLVTLLRLREGKKPSEGGTDHSSHRLVRKGLTQQRAVVVLFVAQGLVSALGLLVFHSDGWVAAVTAAGVALVFILFGAYLARPKSGAQQPAPVPASEESDTGR